MENSNIQIISKWNKPGIRWVYVKDDKKGYWQREKTGKRMAMAFVIVDGKKVTRHIEL